MIIANAIFYNGNQPDKVYLGENLVWEKETTPPTPTYGSNVFAGKFRDNSMESDWEFWPNGATGASSTKINDYVDPETKEFNFEYDGTLTSCQYLLNGNLSSAKFQRIDHIPDTSAVTSMKRMFANNFYLEEANISDLDVRNVTDMGFMFMNCQDLKSLDFSGWETSNLRDMDSMFSYCYSLTSLDLSGLDVSKVTTLARLCTVCKNLKTLNLSGWNTEKVTTIYSMINSCQELTTLNLSGWNLSKATNLFLANNAYKLTTVLGPISGINVDLELKWFPFTNASAMVFINGLAEVATAKTIIFKSTTYDTLTPEQLAIANSKGWSVVRS